MASSWKLQGICVAFVLLVGLYATGVDSQPIAAIHFFRYCAISPPSYATSVLPDPSFSNYDTLTNVGVRQCYQLGLEMKARYTYSNGPLTAYYDSRTFYSRTNQLNKTLMSAQSYFLGLFSGEGRFTGNVAGTSSGLPPINLTNPQSLTGTFALPGQQTTFPVHAMQDLTDLTLSGTLAQICPKMQQTQNNWQLNSTQKQQIENLFSGLYSNLQSTLGLPAGSVNVNTVNRIHDTLNADYYAGNYMRIPYNSTLFNQLTLARDIAFSAPRFPSNLTRQIALTPIFQEVFNWFDAIISGNTNVTFASYPTTENTLAALLIGLNITTPECLIQRYQNGNFYSTSSACPSLADFSSGVVFELAQNAFGTGYVINVLYNDVSYQVCVTPPCDYSQFKQNVTSNMVSSYYTQCGIVQPDPPEKLQVYQIFVGLSALAWLISILVCIGCCVRYSVEKNKRGGFNLESAK